MRNRAIEKRSLRLESLEERTLLAVMSGADFGDYSDYSSSSSHSVDVPVTVNVKSADVTGDGGNDRVVTKSYDVTDSEDADYVGTLRWAIENVGNGGTITFDADAMLEADEYWEYYITVSDQIEVSAGKVFTIDASDITVAAGCYFDLLEIALFDYRGSSSDPVFVFESGCDVTIDSLVIDGFQSGASSTGGAICNRGTLTLNNCMIAYCFAEFGGGIYNAGTLTMNENTQVAYCYATGSGGGIYNAADATLTMNNSSVHDCQAYFVIGDGGDGPLEGPLPTAEDSGEGGVYGGGGVFNAGSLTMVGSSVYNSMFFLRDARELVGEETVPLPDAESYVVGGGGIFNAADATLNMTDSDVCYCVAGFQLFHESEKSQLPMAPDGWIGAAGEGASKSPLPTAEEADDSVLGGGGVFNAGEMTMKRGGVYGNSIIVQLVDDFLAAPLPGASQTMDGDVENGGGDVSEYAFHLADGAGIYNIGELSIAEGIIAFNAMKNEYWETPHRWLTCRGCGIFSGGTLSMVNSLVVMNESEVWCQYGTGLYLTGGVENWSTVPSPIMQQWIGRQENGIILNLVPKPIWIRNARG